MYKIKKLNLISLLDISTDALNQILTLTGELKKKPLSKSTFLKNKSIALIFAKPSLRTRVSFEVGINQFGGNPITIKMDEISVGKRENVEDIASVLSKYVSAIVIRTFEQKQIEELGKYSAVPVVNALSNDEHPCQIVSDLFTIKEIFKTFSGLKLAYVGDGNNIVHSLLLGCAMAKIDVSIASPKNYQPNDFYIHAARKINPKIKIELTANPKIAVKDANIVYTDTWISMGQEKELKKRIKIFKPYQVNDELLSYADKKAVVMHCLPAHKGQEITDKAFDRFSKVIYQQAENRLHAQKAILMKLIGQ